MSGSWSKRESYLMVDHRASPGITEADRRDAQQVGWALPAVTEGKLGEFGVLVCLHCQAHVVRNPLRERTRAYCPGCNGFICDLCEFRRHLPGYSHVPFKKLVDETLEKAVRPHSFAPSPFLLKGD